MHLSALFLSVILALCGDVKPKTLDDFVHAGVGYLQPAWPAKSTLTQNEIARWRGILGATDGQMVVIERMYQDHLRDVHNPHLEREVPRYLAKAAEASVAFQTHGMTSSEFNTAWMDVSRSSTQLMNSSAELELKFIDSLEPLLLPDQIKGLHVLRGFASRRKSRSVVSTDRWILLELREVWEPLVLQGVDVSPRLAVSERLWEYEQSLTALLDQWSTSQLDAGRKIQSGFSAAARNGYEDPQFDPKRIWARSAALTKRIRELHLSVNIELLTLVSPDVAREVRTVVNARLFPELYPDESHGRVEQSSQNYLKRATLSADSRTSMIALRATFDQTYDDISLRLEAACIAWDDEVASGVGQARPQDLVTNLVPLLKDRQTICEEFLKRCDAAAFSSATASNSLANAQLQVQAQAGVAATDKPLASTRDADDNAATLWQNIFPHIRQEKIDSGLTNEDWNAISDIARGNPQPTPKEIERGRIAMSKLGSVLDDVVSTSKLRKCDFEHDYSQGFEMPLPELSNMRQAARILGARANLALADGDWDTYLDTAGAASNLSIQISQSPALVSALVSASVGDLAMSSAQQLVEEGSLTPEKAAKLLQTMEPLRGTDPHGYSNSFNDEYKLLISSKMDGKQLSGLSGEQTENNALQKLDTEEVQKAVLPLAGLYQEAAACFLEPNKEAAMKRLHESLATVETLPKNSQALLQGAIMPGTERILNKFFDQHAKTDALMTALQGIASGKLSAGAIGVPAIWWSRAAAAARALNDEQQAAIELLRFSSVTDGSTLLATAITTLDACDTTVFECMRRAMACESKVVSFEKLSKAKVPLDLALVGGLRGAARMALAKSMLPKLDAEQSLGFICMAIAASNALTSNPTFTHALGSQSIAEEIAVAVGHFAIRSGVTDELRGKLDVAIATIGRDDAFGFRAAQKKTRAELATVLQWHFDRNEDVTEALTKALAQKSAPWLFAVDIVYRSNDKPSESAEGTLVSMNDLLTPESVKEIIAAWEKKSIQDEKERENEDAQAELEQSQRIPQHLRVQKFVGKLDPPTMRDIALDMNRVGGALSKIDAAAALRAVKK